MCAILCVLNIDFALNNHFQLINKLSIACIVLMLTILISVLALCLIFVGSW